MNRLQRDLVFASIVRGFRQERVMSVVRPKMPDWSPGVGGGIGAAGAILYFTQGDASEWVRLAGVVCSAVAVCVVAWCERHVKGERNETERERLRVIGAPSVLLTEDADADLEELEDSDE